MNQKNSTRNYAIDWIKGFMIIIVVLIHTQVVAPLHHGYLAVDVFFFISGFYLMRTFDKRPGTAVSYTWSRVKRFYLPYILCFIVSCLLRYEGLTSLPDYDTVVERIARFPFYLTLTEEIGPRILFEHILDGSWYLSVLLIAGFLIYSMLEYNRELSVRILFPAICILGFTFMFTQDPKIMNWSRYGAVSIPLLRGFTEMTAGAMLFEVFHAYNPAVERRYRLINIASVLSFLILVAMMFATKALDVYLIGTIPFIILGSVIKESWFNKLLSRFRGGLLSLIGRHTIYVLFAHPPVLLVVYWVNENLLDHRLGALTIVLLDLGLSAIATVCLVYICKFIRMRTANLTTESTQKR